MALQKIETKTALKAALAGVDEVLFVVGRGGSEASYDSDFHTGILLEIPVDMKPTLLSGLPETGCTRLGISWLDIDANDAELIVSALPDLIVLDLGGNRIGASGASALSKNLPKLKKLYLPASDIDDHGAGTSQSA